MINITINLVKHFNDSYLLYPAKIELAALLSHTLDDNNVTVVTSNTSSKTVLIMYQALGLMIEPNLVVANTRATSFFLTKGAPCQNKRRALNPISITLINGRKIMPTHLCDLTRGDS
jgi:hypothetical protein